jgi:hypothetical protein
MPVDPAPERFSLFPLTLLKSSADASERTMHKKLFYIALIAIAALFPALGACYEREIASRDAAPGVTR